MQNFFTKLSRLNKHILPEEGPWAALLLIPVTIISGAYWTSIPYYGVIAILWLFQRKTPIPWESGLTIMFTTLIGIFIVSKTDYSFWIYTIKIIGCFIVVSSLRPTIHSHQRLWIDIYFVIALGIVWETNALMVLGRWSFNLELGRVWFPNWTAIYCFLFAMLAVRWRLFLALIVAIIMGWLTESRNFALALGVVGVGYIFLPIWRWIFSKTSRTIVLYLFMAGSSLFILEQISIGQWPGYSFFGERILEFNSDPIRLEWNMIGIKEWTKNLQTFAWGMGDWPNIAPNPHHSLIHTLMERGIVATSALLIFLMSDLSKYTRGMEPWLLGWFSLGMYLHLNFVTMFWVIAMLILRCRYVKNGGDVQEDAVVEWFLLKSGFKWIAYWLRKMSL